MRDNLFVVSWKLIVLIEISRQQIIKDLHAKKTHLRHDDHYCRMLQGQINTTNQKKAKKFYITI